MPKQTKPFDHSRFLIVAVYCNINDHVMGPPRDPRRCVQQNILCQPIDS